MDAFTFKRAYNLALLNQEGHKLIFFVRLWDGTSIRFTRYTIVSKSASQVHLWFMNYMGDKIGIWVPLKDVQRIDYQVVE